MNLLFVVISFEKNLISGPYRSVSPLLIPGIILSNFSKPSIMFIRILCGRTSARSPATQSFIVGSTNPLLILFQSDLLPFFKSCNVWIIGFPAPRTLAILAIDSPYNLVSVTGEVKFTLDINAKLLLFDFLSFNEYPLTQIYPSYVSLATYPPGFEQNVLISSP